MYEICETQWDELFDYWDAFETHGLTPCHLLNLPMPSPIAVVGSGRGFNVAELEQDPTKSIHGFDTSPKMVAEATRRVSSPMSLVSPDNPIPEGLAFRTVIVATGVVDVLEPAELRRFLARLKQHISPESGFLHLSAFVKSGSLWRMAEMLGSTHDLGVIYAPLVQHCVEMHDPSENQPRCTSRHCQQLCKTISDVARMRETSFSAAGNWLSSKLPIVDRQFDRSELSDAVQQAGLTVTYETEFSEQGIVVISGAG